MDCPREGVYSLLGAQLSLLWVLPFLGMLLSIGVLPLIRPHLWEHHFHHIAVGWSLILAIPFLVLHGEVARHELLHIIFKDYIPFVVLIGSLYVISGGILIRGTFQGTPATNTSILVIGGLIASWIGTTGASMLLIRPLLRANEKRRYKVHTLVFFIFVVSNVGGALTPLGDPPLFIGYLNHVPFFWPLFNLWPAWMFTLGVLVLLYLAWDTLVFRFWETGEAKLPPTDTMPFGILGKRNFILLVGIILAVLISGSWKPRELSWDPFGRASAEPVHANSTPSDSLSADARSYFGQPARGETNNGHGGDLNAAHEHGHGHETHDGHSDRHGFIHEGRIDFFGVHLELENMARDVAIVLLAVLSLLITPRPIRVENRFSWFPIREVAWLFWGIFITMVPALQILAAGEDGSLRVVADGLRGPASFFFLSGILSSFLDNAPTYYTFFATALGRYFPGMEWHLSVPLLIEHHSKYLAAISMGAVFMGANTYIGNAPNFMVKSIAEANDVRMPSFFGYIFLYSIPILGPIYFLIWLIFLR